MTARFFPGTQRCRYSYTAITALGSGNGRAALVGSASRGTEDRRSDIDLVLQLAKDTDEAAVVARWTRSLDEKYGVADTLDVTSREGVRYRVFLLASSLQVDLSFWPHELFRATEDGFQLVFGQANPPTSAAEPDTAQVIGLAWLYALHARSAIAAGARGKPC